MPYDLSERMNTNGRISEQKEKYSVTEALEGESWAGLPVGYGYHLWLFIQCLSPSERDILTYLLSCNRGQGIYPSFDTIFKCTGITTSNLSRYIGNLASKDILVCPICNFKSSVIEILVPRKKGKKLKYGIKPFLGFVSHMNSHYKNNENEYLEFRDKIIETRRLKFASRSKNFEGRDDF